LHDFFAERGIEVQLHPIDGTGVWFHKPELITAAVVTKQQSGAAVLVNLGCGSRWHQDWINIDFRGDNVNVFQHNLREGLPLPDASADCIYASHCLEHFTPHDAEQFLLECARVLKLSGILRIVVPDMEQITRAYLSALDAARAADDNGDVIAKHEWMIIELVDQLCRNQGGGEMLRLWSQPDVAAEDFILSRVGTEYINARNLCKGMMLPYSTDPLQVGAFRLGGEPHQWMYDELSLGRLLHRCGFIDVKKMEAISSRLDDFTRYCLDINEDSTPYKPDSLYMEAFLGKACA
jgi:SAM-dependent methyltransferase